MKKLVEESFDEYVENEKLNENIFDEDTHEEDSDDEVGVLDEPEEDESIEDIPEEDVKIFQDDADSTDVEEIAIEDEGKIDDLIKTINNEIDVSSEIDRIPVTFKLKSTKEIVQAVPMARLGGGSSYVFKFPDGTIKKINVTDILEESLNEEIKVDFAPKKLNEDEWLNEVWNVLIDKHEYDPSDADMAMEVSLEELLYMFDEGMTPEEAVSKLLVIIDKESSIDSIHKRLYVEPEESFEEEKFEE